MEYPQQIADPHEIRRDELLARLERARPKVLVLIAPAGYGKSTFVRQFLAGRSRYATCDCSGVRDDLDLARRLLPALAAENPSRERTLTRGELLLGDGGTSVAERIHLALEAWQEPAEGTFIFENAESVAESPSAREFLVRLLASVPAGRCVVICTRSHLRVHLTRFVPPHEIVVLRANDLAFDAADVRAVFARELGADDASIERIVSVSRGWPIAVLLFKRFAAERRFATLLDRLGDVAFEELHDYLLDQVLASLDEPLAQAIFACACIPNATSLDVRAALEDSRAVADVERFAHDSPFLARNDDGSFTVHPLLASFLVGERGKERVELLTRVAARYEASGDFERAAELHLARGDQHAAARALGRHEVALDRSPSMAYARVLSSLDRVLVQRYPRLWSVTCLLRIFCVDMETLLDEAESVWRTMAPATPAFERFYVFVFRVLLMNYVGSLGEALAAIGEFAAAAGTEESETPLGAWVLYLRALIAARQGRLGEAERDFTVALPVVSSMDVMASGSFLTLGADIARVRGERAVERQFVDHAVDLARRSALTNFVGLGLAEAAFGAWLAGEDDAYARYAAELDLCVERSAVRALAYFAAVAGGVDAAPVGGESPRHLALGLVISAANSSDDAVALRHARAAFEAAHRYDSPFVECIAATAVALCDAGAFDASMAQAGSAAMRCDAPALHEAVAALARRDAECGFLTRFAQRFTADRRKTIAPVAVEFSTGAVRVRDGAIRLADREAGLLFALSLRRDPTPRIRLAAMLWPELDDDAARNALSVCLHRLRRHVGDAAIVRDGDGYRLCDGARVDLWDMERRLALLRTHSRLDDGDRAALAAHAKLLGAQRPVRMDQWEWFEPVARRLDELRVEVTHRLAADALERNEPLTALERAEEIVAHDPYDEPAREVAIRAHLALGDRAAAVRHYRRYRELLFNELQCEPSAALTQLLFAREV